MAGQVTVRHIRVPICALITAATAFILSSCAPQPHREVLAPTSEPRSSQSVSDVAPPRGERTPSESTPAGIQVGALPIDRFRFSDSELREIAVARRQLIRRCVSRFGIALPKHRKVPEVGPRTSVERRYGVADSRLAASAGYHLGDRDPRTVDGKDRWLEDISPDTETVLFGELVSGSTAQPTAGNDLRLRGQLIRAGGCVGKARDSLQENVVDPKGTVGRIDLDSWKRARNTSSVVVAAQNWVDCMHARGYHYTDPFSGINDLRFAGESPSTAEIRTAVDDVQCRTKSDLVQIWYRQDVKIQKEIIRTDEVALSRISMAQAKVLTLARELG